MNQQKRDRLLIDLDPAIKMALHIAAGKETLRRQARVWPSDLISEMLERELPDEIKSARQHLRLR